MHQLHTVPSASSAFFFHILAAEAVVISQAASLEALQAAQHLRPRMGMHRPSRRKRISLRNCRAYPIYRCVPETTNTYINIYISESERLICIASNVTHWWRQFLISRSCSLFSPHARCASFFPFPLLCFFFGYSFFVALRFVSFRFPLLIYSTHQAAISFTERDQKQLRAAYTNLRQGEL